MSAYEMRESWRDSHCGQSLQEESGGLEDLGLAARRRR